MSNTSSRFTCCVLIGLMACGGDGAAAGFRQQLGEALDVGRLEQRGQAQLHPETLAQLGRDADRGQRVAGEP
jgi:hypothetical protein